MSNSSQVTDADLKMRCTQNPEAQWYRVGSDRNLRWYLGACLLTGTIFKGCLDLIQKAKLLRVILVFKDYDVGFKLLNRSQVNKATHPAVGGWL